MRFINKARQSGKTVMMIHSAYTTGYPIIVTTQQRKELIIKQAQDISCDNIEVCTVEEWNRSRVHHMTENIFVDEAEDLLKKILNEYLHANVVAATLSLPMNDKRVRFSNGD